MNKIYMDYNSTTPVDQRVVDEMLPYFTEEFGNPSSIHSFGQDALSGVDMARLQVSQLIGANVADIIFTAGGTESNNFALTGLSNLYKSGRNHIITSTIEHSSVYGQCKQLEAQGVEVTYIPTDEFGQVDPSEVSAAIKENTGLISIMYANNEYGTIQRIKEISAIAKDNNIIVHTDAVQAVGKIQVNVQDLGVHMLSISSHKLYGPKGVGALFVKRGITLSPLLIGGGQEEKRRSGTENVPGIVGFGKACELAKGNLGNSMATLSILRDKLQKGILDTISNTFVNGHILDRTPNTLNISFAGRDSETLVVQLDLEGIAVSTGSACGEINRVPSRSLTALGISDERIDGTLRFSLGNATTEEDITRVLEVLKLIVQ